MIVLERLWTTVTYLTSWLTFSPIEKPSSDQFPLGRFDIEHESSLQYGNAIESLAKGPSFKPPTGRIGGLPGSDFTCEYPSMIGWEPCSSPRDRGCWLRNARTFQEFNIYTDYEQSTPTGIDRYYTLEAVDFRTLNADGIIDPWGKAFQDVTPDAVDRNPQFPGPWIQACWGDTLHVTIINKMTDNGTSIHWHGIRQNYTMPMDGVNGITQCPIPPGSSFTYSFNITQYGSSWYHSHYSVQYADGLQGPLTIHGPTSANFDEAKYPVIMTDWGHLSASRSIYGGPSLDGAQASILLNGTGNVTHFNYKNTSAIPSIYQMQFEGPFNGSPRRYLIRLINTAFTTTFTFSIDNHTLQVISSDFVPIVPYLTHSVNVAIGQRYNIIVFADQYNSSITDFWIHTYVAPCSDGVTGGIQDVYDKTGIVRYNPLSKATPTSSPWPDVTPRCADETNLHPVVPWFVGKAANGNNGEAFNIDFGAGQNNPAYFLANFALQKTSPNVLPEYNFQINYSDPILLDLQTETSWPGPRVVIPETYTAEDWVYMVIINPPLNISGNLIPLQHPIHLHGHDFAILKVSNTSFHPSDLAVGCPDNRNLTFTNPPRRDVVLVPSTTQPGGGHAIIAFRTDNPGSWIMHCHIAFHASSGLALQVLERLPDAQKVFSPSSAAYKNAAQLCDQWIPWWEKRLSAGQVQDDSGI